MFAVDLFRKTGRILLHDEAKAALLRQKRSPREEQESRARESARGRSEATQQEMRV
jgi:hypothetical protein